MTRTPRYSVITPSTGRRPKALSFAIASVERALCHAGLDMGAVEMLVGFDGVRGERVSAASFIRWFDIPADGDFGNGIRNALLKAARGERLLFLDDDNALTPEAFSLYDAHAGIEMVVGRIDTSASFDIPFLPRPDVHPITPGNVDPLCLCVTRELAVTRCGGWQGSPVMPQAHERHFRYESDFLNIHKYWRRAMSTLLIDAFVGIYDAGCGLDPQGMNTRQTRRALRDRDSTEKS